MLLPLLRHCIDREHNESTAFPYWIIVDPARVHLSRMDQRVHEIAAAITGPFFSRKRAQEFLDATRYNFSKHAVVYCASGHKSAHWIELLAAAKLEKETEQP